MGKSRRRCCVVLGCATLAHHAHAAGVAQQGDHSASLQSLQSQPHEQQQQPGSQLDRQAGAADGVTMLGAGGVRPKWRPSSDANMLVRDAPTNCTACSPLPKVLC